MKKNVIVFGASGKTGVQICKQLDTQDIEYTVFVREASTDKLPHTDMDTILGDVLNSQNVVEAFKEKKFSDVIISLGSKSLRNSTVRSEGTQNIIKAMKLADSQATVHVVSALGVRDSWVQLKWHAKLLTNMLLKSVMTDHHKQESIVIDSLYQHHILRPVGLKDSEPIGSVHVQPDGFLPSNAISRADVALYLVESMQNGIEGTSSICSKNI